MMFSSWFHQTLSKNAASVYIPAAFTEIHKSHMPVPCHVCGKRYKVLYCLKALAMGAETQADRSSEALSEKSTTTFQGKIRGGL